MGTHGCVQAILIGVPLMIKKKGNKWILYTHDGKKVLGTFSSRELAMKREKQVIYFKNKKH